MTFFPRDVPERRGAAALLGSALVHGALLGGLSLHSSFLPQHALLTPLRFSGQTFDIDALGAPTEDDAAPASPTPASSAEPKSAPKDRHSLSPEDSEQTPAEPAQGSRPEPKSPTFRDEELPEPTERDPEKEADAPPVSATEPPVKNSPTARDPSASPQALPPADPFDLGVPGEPTSSSSSPPRPTTGAYGQDADTTTTVDLFAAFLKTLPLAAKADPAWLRTPSGKIGEIEIIVTVNENGVLLPIQVVQSPASLPPALLERAVLRNRNFLRHGRFALNADQPSGSQRLRLTAVVESRPPDANHPDASGVRAFGLHGGWPPTGTYFTYFSGKHVEIRMKRVP